ncbi:MAG: hypothetical protein COT73_11885 [Bdellovibrio sp. CG10_big_fil_rev_8_21_14_0_10_47_8]|nr:MAG: hypothetical protein COT73_11885 [Bdellovibrio sp. CG10_big_fil_rev_8_21_14_0_10_47_8]
MPSIKDFEKKAAESSADESDTKTAKADTKSNPSAGGKTKKRRPGRDSETQAAAGETSEAEVQIVDVETGETHSSATESLSAEVHGTAEESSKSTSVDEVSADLSEDTNPKIELKFTGSEILRAKFPRPFEMAEVIATDWLHDGKFEGLPIDHPLAQYFAAKGLRKAKELEKKVLESPVTEKLAMQVFQAGIKAQQIIEQVRSRVKK